MYDRPAPIQSLLDHVDGLLLQVCVCVYLCVCVCPMLWIERCEVSFVASSLRPKLKRHLKKP